MEYGIIGIIQVFVRKTEIHNLLNMQIIDDVFYDYIVGNFLLEKDLFMKALAKIIFFLFS